MKILWIGLGIAGVFQISTGLCTHYGYDPKVVSIVGNCTLPVVAALLVALINVITGHIASLTDEEE